MLDKEKAKRVQIVDYLASRGFSFIKSKSKGKYYRYLSMLHNENHPSFFVDKHNNMWADFGVAGRRFYDVIELVRRYEGVSFVEAVKILLEIEVPEKNEGIEMDYIPGIGIKDVHELQNPRLILYLQERQVDIDIARIYCQEGLVNFPLGSQPDKFHPYVVFKNDKGGYECRNYYDSDIAKVSTSPKYFTRFSGIPDEYILFEGFINFLSELSDRRIERFDETTVILNSLVNIVYLYNTLKKNKQNYLYLDNDISADKYIFRSDKKLGIISLKEREIPYVDRRNNYSRFNDINDLQKGKLTI